MTYSRAGSTTIGPGCLTAVFGMGTGGAIRAWSPGISRSRAEESFSVRIEPGMFEHGVNAVKRSAVSTGQLSTLLCLHTQPIDLVFFQEPVSCDGKPDLGGGFTLR